MMRNTLHIYFMILCIFSLFFVRLIATIGMSFVTCAVSGLLRPLAPCLKQGRKNMACPHCGAPDQTDLSAENHGLMLRSEAAKLSGRSRTWIDSRITSRELEIRQFAGRPYVVVASLERLLRVEGGPTSANAAFDRLMAAGRVVEAQELHKQLHPAAWMGSGVMPSPRAVTSDQLPDPWHGFVARNLEGGE